MRINVKVIRSVWILQFLIFSAAHVSLGDEEASKSYSTPAAVFDAYRDARTKRDAHAIFSLLTPEAQNSAVFESFFGCMERQGGDAVTGQKAEADAIGAIVGKYVETHKLDDDYQRLYQKKHGIDLAKARAGHENDPKFVPPPHDDQLYRDVVAAHVKDKAGFYEAVAKYFDKRAAKQHEENPVSPLGDLEDVAVDGDTAKGSSKMTILRRRGDSQPKPGRPPAIYNKPFKFRRINGGWLIDSF